LRFSAIFWATPKVTFSAQSLAGERGINKPRSPSFFALQQRFLVRPCFFALPIPRKEGFALRDEDRKSLFTNWLVEHGSSVLKVARAYTLTNDECQDLAQEILLQAWRSLPSFAGKATAATWFYRVALQTAMNWQRHDKPRRTRQQPLVEVQVAATDGSTSAEQAQRRETVEQLYNAIHRLPKADAALVLLYLDGLTYRDMADVLGISENHVGVKLNRAKKTLSALMNGRPHGT
jgi:RNA polymerase sigma-70 factor (ECF subfamily)